MQSILFGGALLEDETTETFVWLFSQFRRYMFDRPPTAIITDQDAAICKAVGLVFPESRHRYCLWHVRKHELEHLQGYRSRYPNFDHIYQRWVRSDTPAEFEAGWQNMLMQFDVEPRCWLRTMYEKRHHWIKCYLNDTFWTGMSTTGRSESINAYFDGYVNSNTMLNEFVVQYDKAIRTRRESEDFQTMNTQATLSGRHPIEKAAGDRYTRRVFRKFQAEFIASNNCTHTTLNKDGCSGWYRVGHVDEDQRRWKVVQYTAYEGPFVRCSCALFETQGILCQHALYIMKKKKVVDLPEQFISS